jgi:hypothetical protein
MSQSGNSSRRRQAGRALRAFEQRASARIGDARSVLDRLRAAPSQPAGEPHRPAPAAAPAPTPAPSQPAPAPLDVSEIEVRDLRVELARELDRLAGADISASRGGGKVAGETPAGDGRA